MDLTLETVKNFLRVTYNEDDKLIEQLTEASKADALNYLNLDQLPDESPVQAAIFLLIGDLYEHREAQTDKQLTTNMAVYRLLNPYRRHCL